ncbi:MAG: tRNA uridine-5-carboxymethylaminomethyl(34) synthesis GTPase MnmE [Thermodesulfobacteriota bacterium]
MDRYIFDTIAAVATPAGEGGIGIIRISGPDALQAGRKIFSPAALNKDGGHKERYLYYGRFADPRDASLIDDGFLVHMKGPASYTGEDVVELHLHGGALVLKKAMGALLRAGLRAAEPGEFTRRAFLNDRLDLAQAEAVIDVIRAGTGAALASARARLDGALSKRVNEIKSTVADLVARIEAVLDFPEDVFPEEEGAEAGPSGPAGPAGPDKKILEEMEGSSAAIKKLINTFDEGRALREGVRVLILGRPNVGKSSLLNILLREERAIVAPMPGTTRDVIEEAVNIKGVTARLMDTAGLRETADFVESIGVKAAREKIKGAGLILFVIDASEEDYSADIKLLAGTEGKKVIIVVNKIDLVGEEKQSALKERFKGQRVEFISAIMEKEKEKEREKEEGIEGLEEAIFEEALGRSPAPGGLSEADRWEMITSVRHKNCLEEAVDAIERARRAVFEGLEAEFVAADLRAALKSLGEITGEVTTEEILDRIFSEFCIGK